jgi:hypothetical protein
MANFTPGPWGWVEGSPIISRQWNGKDWPVATVANRNLGWHENHNCEARESGANAQLIAEAPNMYNSLIAASHALRSYQYGNSSPGLAIEMADKIDEVIAKADGKQAPDAL